MDKKCLEKNKYERLHGCGDKFDLVYTADQGVERSKPSKLSKISTDEYNLHPKMLSNISKYKDIDPEILFFDEKNVKNYEKYLRLREAKDKRLKRRMVGCK